MASPKVVAGQTEGVGSLESAEGASENSAAIKSDGSALLPGLPLLRVKL